MVDKKNSGLSVVPVIVSLLITFVIFVTVFNIFIKKKGEQTKIDRRIATQMSDYGFQHIMEPLRSMEELANDSFSSVDSTADGEGWYKIEVHKEVKYDTMYISIESFGGAGTEVVKQQKIFKLLKCENEKEKCWQALLD